MKRAVPLAALALAAACGEAPRAEEPAADPFELWRNAGLLRRMEVVVESEEPAATVRWAAGRLRARGWRVDVVHEKGSERAVRAWIGSAAAASEAPWVAEAWSRLGVDLGERDAVAAMVEDPAQRGFPLLVFAGGEAALAERVAENLEPPRVPGFRLWRGGELSEAVRLGPGAERRELAAAQPRAPNAEESRASRAGLEVTLERGVDSAAAETYLASCVAARGHVLALRDQGERWSEPQLGRVRLHAHPEDLARIDGGWTLAARNRTTGEVSALVAPFLPHDGGAELARACALELLGEPAQEWLLEGLGAHAADTWWGRPLHRWAAHLVRAGLVPELAELIEPGSELSPHVAVPLRAMLLRRLLASRGPEAVLELWKGAPLEIDAELREGMAKHLARVARAWAGELATEGAARLRAARERPFRTGLVLEEPIDLRPLDSRGLGSRACDQSLERIRALGANAVALAFETFLDEGPPELAGARRRPLEPTCGDVAIAAAAARARSLGMEVMLRPALRTSRAGPLAGQALVDSEGSFDRLFAGARAHLVHAALLGELCGAEILSLGEGIPVAAVTRRAPGDAEWPAAHFESLRERWSGLIAALRGAFGGMLTYGADGTGERGGIEFWSQLDLVGLELFESLSRPPGADAPPADAQAGMRLLDALWRAEAHAFEVQRPFLVTAVGFPATAQAWRAPSRPRGATDEGEQARLARLWGMVVRRFRENHRSCAGVYWWSWSTDPAAGGAGDRGFTPQGKRAEEELARMLFGD